MKINDIQQTIHLLKQRQIIELEIKQIDNEILEDFDQIKKEIGFTESIIKYEKWLKQPKDPICTKCKSTKDQNLCSMWDYGSEIRCGSCDAEYEWIVL